METPSRWRLLVYLLPVVGLVPALWNLATNRPRSRRERELSRSVVTLTGLWLVAYGLLGTAAQQESLALPALVVNSFVTSGYFVLQVWLTLRVWRGESPSLPWLGRLARRLP
ncbi:MAG: hypothetical protein RMI89_06320 [Gloeomargarita sp. SKYBB_i_bin120]|nr:hypothetical protein [Gloeomargarita sp. SKYG98]MCS7292576.1 hypothetical protein [Gloeomargarita sp. SKYB120]MDW8178137.1 hypothetical protein [Gloeomargarita sp. SKYBB_i_bin120]